MPCLTYSKCPLKTNINNEDDDSSLANKVFPNSVTFALKPSCSIFFNFSNVIVLLKVTTVDRLKLKDFLWTCEQQESLQRKRRLSLLFPLACYIRNLSPCCSLFFYNIFVSSVNYIERLGEQRRESWFRLAWKQWNRMGQRHLQPPALSLKVAASPI